MNDNEIVLLDHTGRPIRNLPSPEEQERMSDEAATKMLQSWQTYISALFGLDFEPIRRSIDPFKNHAWVFVATMIKATNLAQAPFLIFRETDEEEERMNLLYRKRFGKKRIPLRGKERTIAQRHLTRSSNPGRYRGFKFKGLEPDPFHPLNNVFLKPNPAITGAQLWSITVIWMSLRGESPWLLTKDNTEFLSPGDMPEQIWPLNPDRLEHFVGEDGELLGYKYTTMENDPRSGGTDKTGRELILMPHEIVMHKYPNPWDPYRGMSPITAAANGIDVDILSNTHNRAVLKNSAIPPGVLSYKGHMEDNEYKKNRKRWNDLHGGAQRAGRTAILSGEWDYKKLGLTPQDMDYINSKRWNRDEVFAVEGVPKSTAGITENLNFATQLGQDKNLWDKRLLPDVRLFEDTLEGTLFFGQPDNVVGAFDLSNIEALRHGISEQLDQITKLTAPAIHMPPRVAMEVTGLEGVPEYEGDDVSLINLSLVPVKDVLALSELEDEIDEDEEDIPEDEDTPEDEGSDEDDEDEEEEEEMPSMPAIRTSKRTKAQGGKRWRDFVRIQSTNEKLSRRSWRKWVRDVQKQQIELLEQNANLFQKQGEREIANQVVIDLEQLQVRISNAFQPTYDSILESTFAHWTGETGVVPTFAIDDNALLRAIDRRFNKLKNTAPRTMSRQLTDAITEGLRNAETLTEIRQRVAKIFNIQLSSAKTLAVARTESASVMNDLREEMFDLQGFELLEWVTAGDENVRDSHVHFGNVGPQRIGTNFIDLPGYPGNAPGTTLRFPGDPLGAPGEVINCRCVKIGVE